MGWTVLYIAFGFVALWLLGEVLLQYKARLRWRLLAFVGFLGVVVGVLIPSVWIIGLGAIAFATGQTYVTLSFRKGFSTGWALGGRPGLSKRRRASARDNAAKKPTLQVSDLEYEQVPPPPAHGPDIPGDGVYEPEPMPDDTGQYGVYDDAAYAPPAAGDAHQSEGHGYDAAAFGGYDQQNYGYDETGGQQYAAYSDPYIGTQTYGARQSYDTYGDQQQYAPYGGDTYSGGLGGTYSDSGAYHDSAYTDTPPGGVWVPQQRTTDDQYSGELPPEQPYPYQGGHPGDHHDGSGHNEQQYRY
ncbi:MULTISPECIES: hypothetical protein [Streptomyces]|uniref:Uncharacterized protein n=1 Tax=Streptomyces venezuelae TaxID=54571 RepID=A0A5P2B860_STRVZ|nr:MULTISPECIES: hypothetical protein [Streptomyces]NDZ97878.1 hypothetical protein [Streptomyces sp. SID10116]MYY82881.1 hypothetical protein [Streptomyces sp. SID335]MYZ14971.1 hypothetical protein [Streptomyces sp. SID337]NDZ91935.1 hypothetical protein [Streptomyces sp. SID10115]NEB50395.1 hypothetical protein [Streptomyces sp. SID339]